MPEEWITTYVRPNFENEFNAQYDWLLGTDWSIKDGLDRIPKIQGSRHTMQQLFFEDQIKWKTDAEYVNIWIEFLILSDSEESYIKAPELIKKGRKRKAKVFDNDSSLESLSSWQLRTVKSEICISPVRQSIDPEQLPITQESDLGEDIQGTVLGEDAQGTASGEDIQEPPTQASSSNRDLSHSNELGNEIHTLVAVGGRSNDCPANRTRKRNERRPAKDKRARRE